MKLMDMNRIEMMNNLTYEEKKALYGRHFSLGSLSTDISNKLALVSLICFLTNAKQKQEPSYTTYKMIQAVTKKNPLPIDYVETLSIICDDYMYMCDTFPTFGLKTVKEMIDKLNEIISTWLPF